LTPDLWRQTRPAVLTATHNLAEAGTMADRILVLSGMPASAATDMTLDRPRNRRDREKMRGVSGQLRHIAGNSVMSGKTDAL